MLCMWRLEFQPKRLTVKSWENTPRDRRHNAFGTVSGQYYNSKLSYMMSSKHQMKNSCINLVGELYTDCTTFTDDRDQLHPETPSGHLKIDPMVGYIRIEKAE